MKRIVILIGLLIGIFVWYQIWTPQKSENQPTIPKEEEKQTQKAPKHDPSEQEEASEKRSEKLNLTPPKIQDVTGGKLKPPAQVVETAGRFHWLIHLSGPMKTQAVLQELEKISRPEIMEVLREEYTVENEEQIWDTILVGAIKKEKGLWKVQTVAQINQQPTTLYMTLKKGGDGKWKVWELSENPS